MLPSQEESKKDKKIFHYTNIEEEKIFTSVSKSTGRPLFYQKKGSFLDINNTPFQVFELFSVEEEMKRKNKKNNEEEEEKNIKIEFLDDELDYMLLKKPDEDIKEKKSKKNKESDLFVSPDINIADKVNFNFYKDKLKIFFLNNKVFPQSRKKTIKKYYLDPLDKCVNGKQIAELFLSFSKIPNSELIKELHIVNIFNKYLGELNMRRMLNIKFGLNAFLVNFNSSFCPKEKWGKIKKAFRGSQSNEKCYSGCDIISTNQFFSAYTSDKLENYSDDDVLINAFPGYTTIFQFNFKEKHYVDNFSNYIEYKEEGELKEILIAPFTKFTIERMEIRKGVKIVKLIEFSDNLLINSMFSSVVKDQNTNAINCKISYCSGVVDFKNNIFNEDSVEKTVSLIKFGDLFKEISISKSINYYTEAMNLVIKNYGFAHFETFKIYNQIANTLKDINLIKANDLYESSLLIMKNIYGMKNRFVAHQLNKIAEMKIDESEKIDYYEKSLEILRSLKGNEREVIDQCRRLALVYKSNHQIEKAVNQLKSALDFKKIKENIETADLYNDIGDYTISHDPHESLNNYMKSFEIKEKVLGIQNEHVKKQIRTIFSCYKFVSSENQEGLKFIDSTIKKICLKFGEKSIETAEYYNFLSDLFKEISYFKKSVEYSENAIKILISIKGEKSLEVALQYQFHSKLYSELKNEVKYTKYLEKATKIMIGLFGEQSKEYINFIKDYSDYFFKVKKLTNAKIFVSKRLELLKNNGDENEIKIQISKTYKQLGDCSNDPTEETDYYDKSTAIIETLFGKDSKKLAKLHNSIAESYFHKNQFDKSVKEIDKSLKIFNILTGHDSLIVAHQYILRGNYGPTQDIDSKVTNYHNAYRIKSKMYSMDKNQSFDGLIKSSFEMANLLKSIKLDLSLEFIKDGIENMKKVYGVSSLNTALYYKEAAHIYLYTDINTTLNLFNNYIQIIKKIYGEESDKYIRELKNISYELGIKNYESSLSYLEQALNLDKKIHTENSLVYAEDLKKLGDLVVYRNAVNSQNYYELALKILNQNKNLRVNKSLISQLNFSIGTLVKKSNSEKSKDYFNIFLDIQKEINKFNINPLANDYKSVAKLFRLDEDYSIRNYEICLELKIKYFGENTIEVAEIYNEIAETYKSFSKPEKFKEYSDKAVKIYEMNEGVNSKHITDNKKVIENIGKKSGFTASIKKPENLDFTKKVSKSKASGPNSQGALSGYFEKKKTTSVYNKLTSRSEVRTQTDPDDLKDNELINVNKIAFGELSKEGSKLYRQLGDKYKFKNKQKALKYYNEMIRIDVALFSEVSEKVADDCKYVGNCLIYHKDSKSNEFFEREKKIREDLNKKCKFI